MSVAHHALAQTQVTSAMENRHDHVLGHALGSEHSALRAA
jgi:hypothetical protein